MVGQLKSSMAHRLQNVCSQEVMSHRKWRGTGSVGHPAFMKQLMRDKLDSDLKEKVACVWHPKKRKLESYSPEELGIQNCWSTGRLCAVSQQSCGQAGHLVWDESRKAGFSRVPLGNLYFYGLKSRTHGRLSLSLKEKTTITPMTKQPVKCVDIICFNL